MGATGQRIVAGVIVAIQVVEAMIAVIDATNPQSLGLSSTEVAWIAVGNAGLAVLLSQLKELRPTS